jgi:hypothetical protein
MERVKIILLPRSSVFLSDICSINYELKKPVRIVHELNTMCVVVMCVYSTNNLPGNYAVK